MHSMFNPHGHHHRHRGGSEEPRGVFGGGFESQMGPPPFPPQPPPFGPFPGFPGFPGRGHGPRGGHGGRGRGGRQRRGNVRAAVLSLLAERPMHGYEMIQEISQRSNGLWRPSPGSVYPTLQMLADEGLVSVQEEAGGKKLFTLTDAGRTEVEKLDSTPPWEQATDDADPVEVKLRDAVGQLHVAVQQMAQAGSSEQKTRTVEALNEARRKIYGMLAELGADDEE
jgi:DNA-binding PadR family transcriptional regulator